MHQAQIVTSDEAILALSVATTVLEILFPTVVKRMGFHLHEGFKICDNWKCKYIGTEFEKILKTLIGVGPRYLVNIYGLSLPK